MYPYQGLDALPVMNLQIGGVSIYKQTCQDKNIVTCN